MLSSVIIYLGLVSSTWFNLLFATYGAGVFRNYCGGTVVGSVGRKEALFRMVPFDVLHASQDLAVSVLLTGILKIFPILLSSQRLLLSR